MSVVSSTLARTGRTGRLFVDSRGAKSGEASVEWKVITDSDTDGFLTVIEGAKASTPNALPELLTTYNIGGEADTGLFLMTVTPTQNTSKLKEWTVRGTYTSLPFGVTSNDTATPLLRAWKYRLEFDTISKVITQGRNIETLEPLGGVTRTAGEYGPIVNTAGQEFDTVLEEPRTRVILVATKNFGTLAEIYQIGIDYADSINETAFNGYPPRYCEFLGITSSDLINESGVEYYQGIVRIALNQRPVQFDAVNSGWKHWKSATEIVNATDANNHPLTEPIILGSKGTDPNKTVVGVTSPRKEIVSYWTRENEKNFNAIFSSPPPP